MIDDEIFAYRGKSGNSLTLIQRPGANGYAMPPYASPFGGASASHGVGARVQELIHLGQLHSGNINYADDDLHPMELIKSLLDNTGKHGIGEAGVEYDSTSLDLAKATLGANVQFRFLNSESSNAKRFLEEQLFLPCAAYPIESVDGELKIKLFQDGADATIVDTISDDDILERPRWLRNSQKIVTTVVYHYDYVPITKEFISAYSNADAELISELRREVTLEIFGKGIHKEFTNAAGTQEWMGETATFLSERSQAYIDRFGGVAPVLTVRTTLKKHLLEVGDDIEVDFSEVPNLPSATRSYRGRMEIIGMRMDWERGVVDFELLGYPD
jgi:hypothetical protein